MPSPRVSGIRLDQLLQQACEPAFWLSADLRLIWVNHAWEELTGHSAESAIGLVCRAHGPNKSGDLESLGGSFFPPHEVLAGQPSGIRTLVVHSSGERRWRRVEFWPFHNQKNDISAIFGIVRLVDDTAVAPDSEAGRLRVELIELRDRLLHDRAPETLIGAGPAQQRLVSQIAAAAGSNVPVLIVGEPGTGRGQVASAIHQAGPDRQAPLVPFDCAALPHDVLERELFGAPPTPGTPPVLPRLALPGGSTLLIGDIVDLPRDLQARLSGAIGSQVRLIATTFHDPDNALRAERLRPDLYYALTALVIRLPRLRERVEELPLFAQHFLERANERGGRQRSGFTEGALRVFAAYDWPGNFRELARVIDAAHMRGAGDLIGIDDLPAAIRGNLGAPGVPTVAAAPAVSLDELLTRVERRLIENALHRARNNKSRAADLLGISRPRLYRRMHELDLPDVPDNSDPLGVTHDAQS
jgi:DNA-binding NtrC family response regulator